MSTETEVVAPEKAMGRKQASKYLHDVRGVGPGTPGWLARLAMTDSAGPVFFKTGARRTWYFREDLDRWARAWLGAPRTMADKVKPPAELPRAGA
jgi:hypothetical protein